MQNVISKRIASVSSHRIDVPDALSQVIQKMTQRNIEDRYHSTSGLKADLIRIRELLCEGDVKALKAFQVGSKDISCFFNLPLKQIGRDSERQKIVGIIERISKHRRSRVATLNSMSSNSSYSDQRVELQFDDIVSDSTSSRGSESKPSNTQALENGTQDRTLSSPTSSMEKPSGSRPHLHASSRGHSNSALEGALTHSRSHQSTDTSALRRASSTRRLRRQVRCEVVAISGATGLGKSRLVQSVQSTARSAGYFAMAKFDPAKKAPFDPILKLMSSLFRQIFSEADVTTEFHNSLRNLLRNTGVWPVLRDYLDLPEWLLNTGDAPKTPRQKDAELAQENFRRASSPVVYSGGVGHTAETWLRSGVASKSSRFMNVFIDVLRLLAMQKLCIWTLEDVQNADVESAELIHHLIHQAKIPIILILTYNHEEKLSRELTQVLHGATKIQLLPFTEVRG